MGLDGVKIIMITVLDDNKNIIESFRAQCEGYIVKPIIKGNLVEQIMRIGLI